MYMRRSFNQWQQRPYPKVRCRPGAKTSQDGTDAKTALTKTIERRDTACRNFCFPRWTGRWHRKEAVTSPAASENVRLFAFMRLCDESLLFAATYSASGILYCSFEFVQSAAMLASIYQFKDNVSVSLLHRPTSHGSPGRYGELSVFCHENG